MLLVLKYICFATIAITINLATQELSLMTYQGGYALYLSIGCGTLTGLTSKYVLDKLYIFNHHTENLNHDINLFVAYSLTGFFTTVLFWSFELGFEFLFETRRMRYLGATIGLTLGYLLKYQLDKRYVFIARVE